MTFNDEIQCINPSKGLTDKNLHKRKFFLPVEGESFSSGSKSRIVRIPDVFCVKTGHTYRECVIKYLLIMIL